MTSGTLVIRVPGCVTAMSYPPHPIHRPQPPLRPARDALRCRLLPPSRA